MKPSLQALLGVALLSCGACSSNTQEIDRSVAQAYQRSTELPNWVDARNFMVLAPGVAGSGQPTAENIGELAEQGYSTVINLRLPTEKRLENEEQLVTEAGLAYYEIPVSSTSFSLYDAALLEDALQASPSGSVLVHCASGGRVKGLWAMYRGYSEGLSAEETMDLARESGFRSQKYLDRMEQELQPKRPKPSYSYTSFLGDIPILNSMFENR